MKSILTPYRLLPLAAVCAGLAAGSASAAVIYSENFDNTITPLANQSVSTVSWNAYSGATAVDFSATAPGPGVNRIGISNLGGNPSGTPGFLFSVNQTAGSGNLLWAATTTFAAINANSFTWQMGSSDAGNTARVLIQQNGEWFASDGVFSTAAMTLANFQGASAETKNLTFDVAAANWRAVTLTPGVALSVAGSSLGADLDSSTITGVGFLLQHDDTVNTTIRIDSLAIDGTAAIPEPSSFAALLGLGVLGAAATRRRSLRA